MFLFCSNGMDNRINEIRRKISALRAEMLAIEDSIRDQLLQQRKIAGDDDRCPTVEERLKENYRSPAKRNRPLRGRIVHR